MQLLLLPLLWILVTGIISFGGWRQLATQYRATCLPAGADLGFLRWAKVGAFSYKSIIRAGVCPQGLLLTVIFPFRLFHPPLLIPWQVLGSVHTHTGFWDTTYSLTIPTGDTTSEVFQFSSSSFLATLRPWMLAPADPLSHRPGTFAAKPSTYDSKQRRYH